MYTGNSVVDYLKSQGQASDYASRASLAASKGIAGYAGTADQNTQLLKILTSSATTPSQPTATVSKTVASSVPAVTPTQTASVPGTPSPSGTPDFETAYATLYKGWDRAAAQQDYSQGGWQNKAGAEQFTVGGTGLSSSSSSSGSTLGSTGFLNTPTINLPEIYNNLYTQSGVSDLETKLSDQTKAFTDAQSKINDNPFLSEASRVGRLQKLQTDFNNNTTGIRTDIATKKADIETKLNIQTKQFDINSQQATQALSQFNTLLSSGALSSLSGDDIASITKATGMSSAMINAAINANNAKNVTTSTIQFDDGTNQGFAIINTKTGAIIKKEVVAASKPVTKSSTTADTKTDYITWAKTDAKSGKTLDDMMAYYDGYLTRQQIFDLYMSANYYKNSNTQVADAKERWGVK